jgi:hypothetical protein
MLKDRNLENHPTLNGTLVEVCSLAISGQSEEDLSYLRTKLSAFEREKLARGGERLVDQGIYQTITVMFCIPPPNT